MYKDFLSELSTQEPVLLNLTALPRGVNNYHIDVKLSSRFTGDFEKLLAELLRRETSLVTKKDEAAQELIENFQAGYLDMMTVLIHRIKTDLSATEVNFLQFAVIRSVLQSVQNAVDTRVRKLRNQLSELRSMNQAKSLVVQDEIVWISKHYNTIIVNINRRLFQYLRQVETKKLQAVRRQYLDAADKVFLHIMFNPMLQTTNLDSPNFLIETYMLWNKKGETSDFSPLNSHIEGMIAALLPEAPFSPLIEESKPEGQMEIYDDLKGLAACYNHLGPAPNLKNFVSEAFTWLDDPGNFEHLFNREKHQELIRITRKQHGLKAWWEIRKKIRNLEQFLRDLKKYLQANNIYAQLAASSKASRIWKPAMLEFMELSNLCSLLAGGISFDDFEKRYKLEQRLGPAEIKELKAAVKETRQADEYETLVTFLRSLARYRMHLKYYRFAHRLFNRISILTDPEKLQLSSQAGTLYQLPLADEVDDDEVKIAHHTILKADVRGSTTVTDELERQKLNPASYFSLRFFSPINKVLPVYGANKVFIEGDAIILSLLEYEHAPQHWLAVARACGLAKAMLAVVNANNLHSKHVGLPPLELGIGICFAACSPRYLYDGEQPIMISSAIGQADRMSSCSWKLRAAIKNNPFNVEVLRIAADDQSKGEKGQQHIRYNVNGILLENGAFEKLRNEIELTSLTARIDDREVLCHYGEYPDTQGKIRNLVIREARVGLWRNDAIEQHDSDEKFYEVVTNSRIVSGIQDKMYALKGRGEAEVSAE